MDALTLNLSPREVVYFVTFPMSVLATRLSLKNESVVYADLETTTESDNPPSDWTFATVWYVF